MEKSQADLCKVLLTSLALSSSVQAVGTNQPKAKADSASPNLGTNITNAVNTTATESVTNPANATVSQHLISQHLVAVQSGSISDIDTFGVVPQSGDTLDAGTFTITIDQSFSAGQVTDPTGSVALKGEFVVAAGVTLTVNGDWDASHPDTQNLLQDGAHIEFDGQTGISRQYKAASHYYGAPSLVVQSTALDKAFFGLKPNADATFVYNKQGFLGSNIDGGNVHLNGFSTGYIHDGYDRVGTRVCNMPDVLFTNSGKFELRYSAGDNGSCNFENLTILSSTSTTAFNTAGSYSGVTQSAAFNLNGLSVDGGVGYYARPEFMMNDWVLRDLATTVPSIGWQNIDGWLLFNADTVLASSPVISNVYFRNEKYNPHGFTTSSGELLGVNTRAFDSVVFDFINLDDTEAGDMYAISGEGAANEVVSISNNIGLKNLNGKQSSTFVSFIGGEQNGRQVDLQNNVVYIPSANHAISVNGFGATPIGSLNSVKDNIFWGEALQPGYVVGSWGSTSQDDILSSGGYSNNGVFNARTDGQNGALNLPLSYTPDAAVTDNAPRFNDDGRRLDTYGASVLGLDGTAETAFKAHLTRHLSVNDISQLDQMAGHESYVDNHKGELTVKTMIDWIKQGFIATTTTYHNSSSTSGAIGLTATPTFVLADSDNDTVDDKFDLCADTPAGEEIDANGCGESQYIPQHLVALQSGPISDINTFGVLPRDTDTLDAGSFTITIDQSFVAGHIDNPAASVALNGEFVVEAGVTLTVNGDWDASQAATQNLLKTAGVIEFDGQSDVNRRYIATARYYGAPSLVVDSTTQDKAFFGLKLGSAATFAYDKQSFLGSNISGGNVHLNGFSTGYIHDGYDRVETRDCNMPNVLFTNSGEFQLRYFAGNNGSCDLQNLTVLSPTSTSAFRTFGSYTNTTQGAGFNLNGLSVDGGVEYYARGEFLMNDWVLRDLAATSPAIGWQDVDSWLLFNADTIAVGSRLTSNIYFRNEKSNPHGFALGNTYLDAVPNRTFDSVVFDFNNLDANESGDMYLAGSPGVVNETISIVNNVALKNLNGNQSSTFITFNGSDQQGRTLEVENNVIFTPLGNRAIALNEASQTPTGSLAKVSNNIFWGEAGQEGYVIDGLGTTSQTDILAAGAYANNGVYNARNDGSYGELDLPLSYTPQAPVTTLAPRFYDDTRRLDTYGSQVLGLDANAQNLAENAFRAYVTRHLSVNDISRLNTMADHQVYATNHKGTLLIKDMIDWIKQGYIATTSTYTNGSSTSGPLGLAVTPVGFTLGDSDGDTLDDMFDQCAGTPNGESIDVNGCANSQLDDDNDGITNINDMCNLTAASTAVDAQGCSAAELGGDIVGFQSWGIGGGGAMAGYSVNPFNDNMRFVGTDMGTAFRSLNKGVNWTPINHTQTTYSSNLGYAAPFGFAGAATVLHAPEGLNPVRSVDGGQTFTAPASFALVYSNDGDHTNDERVTGWYSDTQNEGIVYATTNLGLWRSVDAGNHWSFVYSGGDIKGMFIDNQEGGKIYAATQDSIVSSVDGTTYITHFTPVGHKIHRFSGGSALNSKTLTYASDESSLAISTSLAAGLIADDVRAVYSKPSYAGDEVSAGMVYVSNNGAAFTRTSQFMGSHLMMAQNDSQTIYATGSRNWGRDKGTSVYISEDAGASWTLSLLQYNWDTGYTPWDSTELEHSPVGLNVGWYDGGYYTASVNQLNSAQFGGSGNFFLHGTETTGSKWQDLTNNYKGTTADSPLKSDEWSTSGLNVTGVYDVKVNPANSNDIYVSSADIHGVRSVDHGQSWQIMPSSQNSIYDYAFDPADANTIYMVNGSQHDWPFRGLSIVGNGGVFKSTNKGDSWTQLTPVNTDHNRQYLSIGFDATRNDIYAGSHSDGISRSLDGGVTWEKFNAGLPGARAGVSEGYSYAMDLVIPQIEVLDNGNVYALVTGFRSELTAEEVIELAIPANELMTDTSSGSTQYFSWMNSHQTGIYMLDVVNGATSWTLLRGNIDLGSHGSWVAGDQAWIRPMGFAVDPNNSDVLWLTDIGTRTNQVRASGVWKSVDNGQNWTFKHQHTLALDINIAPNDSDYVIVTGPTSWDNGGTYVSKDGGENWIKDERAPLQDNAQSVSFDPQDNSKVIYGYFGGGMLYGDKL